MSGSTPRISRVKGAVQVREMVVSFIVTLREPTAERRPKIHNAESLNSRAVIVANIPCINSSEVQLTTGVDISIQVILVMLYSTGKLVSVSIPPSPSINSVVTLISVVTLLRLRFSSGVPFTSHSTPAVSKLREIQKNRALPPGVDVISLSLQPWPSA